MEENLQIIQSKIYEIRGQRVMLDFDLAALYDVETKRLKEAVRRNIERFEGEDFMIELTADEIKVLSRTQFATLNMGRGFNIKYAPFAFTELGVAMLSSILKSSKAIEINRNIMRAFVRMREYLLLQPEDQGMAELKRQIKELQEDIESLEKDHEDYEQHFDDIYLALAELAAKNKEQAKKRPKIGFIKTED